MILDADITTEELELFLRDISLCFPSRDFEAWAARVSLPFTIGTGAGKVVMTSTSQLRANFDRYLHAMDLAGIDILLRTPLSTDPGPDGLRITYRTELLAGGRLCAAPFISTAVLHRDGTGTWRMCAIENGLGHHPWTGITPDKERGLP